MATFKGYTPYAEFMKKLAAFNPAVQYSIKSEPANFAVAKATTAGANTPVQAASTFINRITYMPISRRAFVHIGNNRYWYLLTDEQMSAWMRSPSLGYYYNKNIKLKK